MQITREATVLTQEQVNSDYFGEPNSILGDMSISVLLRYIAIRFPIEGAEPILRGNFDRYRKGSVIEDLSIDKALTFFECDSERAFEERCKVFDEKGEWRTFDDLRVPINPYLSQFEKCKVYVNDGEKKVVAILVDSINGLWLHAFESLFFKITEGFYFDEFPDDLKDYQAEMSLAENKSNKATLEKIKRSSAYLEKLVNDYAEKIGFLDDLLRRKLSVMARSRRNNIVEDLRRTYERYAGELHDLSDRYARKFSECEDARIRLNAMENDNTTDEVDYYGFFKNRRNLKIVSIGEDRLTYVVRDTLEFYDDEEARRVITNPRGYFEDLDEDQRKLFLELFANRRGVIDVSAKFCLRDFKLVRPIQDDDCGLTDVMPNPHLFFFGCSGANEQYYHRYADLGEWDMAIDQSISAAKNINFGDSTVMRNMAVWIRRHMGCKCVYVNDDFSPVDVTDGCKKVSFKEFLDGIRKIENGGDPVTESANE